MAAITEATQPRGCARTFLPGRRAARLCATVFGLTLAPLGTAVAQDVVVTNGQTYTVTVNPTTIDSLNINSGGTVDLLGNRLIVNDNVNTTYAGRTTGVVNVGQLIKAGSGTVTLSNYVQDGGEFIVTGGGLSLTAGATSIRYLAVGSSTIGNATMTMTGGTLTIEGSAMIAAPSLQVGDFGGTGFFNQSGGTVVIAAGGGINIGNQGGTGTYNLSGGELRMEGGLMSIGRSTNATRNSDGTLNVSGTGLLTIVGTNLTIGDRDGPGDASTSHGRINQTGGTIRIQAGAALELAGANNAAAVDGRYDLLGGVLEIGGNSLRERRFGDAAVYEFNLGGGTIRTIGSQLTTLVNATLLAGTTSTFDTNNLGTTWSGTLTGAGGIAKLGLGTLSLQNGGNGFTGGIRVEAGTVTATIDGAIPDGNALVINGGTLDLNDFNLTATALSGTGGTLDLGLADFTVDQAANTSFAGAIVGTNLFNKSGTGTLELTGNSSYSGFINVEAGTLVVNGLLASADAQVFDGARIGGTGTLSFLSINGNGVVAPGNSIGTISVDDFNMNAAGIYEVEVDGAGNSDLIDVTNNATVSNAVLRVFTAAGTQVDVPYVIVNALTVNGNGFTSITDDSLFLDAEQEVTATQILLHLIRNANSFADVGGTPNQVAVGEAIDSLPDGTDLEDALSTLPDAAAANAAFDLLSGEIHASLPGVLLDDSRFLREAVGRRLGSEQPASAKPVLGTAATAWLEGFGSWGSKDGDSNVADLDRDIGGFFLGLDAMLGETVTAGLVAGYSKATVDVSDRQSSADVDTFHVGLYGGANFGGVGLQLGGAFAWHHVDTSRRVTFEGFDESLTADYDARTLQLFGEVNYRFTFEPVSIEPFAGLAWVHVNSDGFDEEGGVAALQADDQEESALFTSLGVRLEAALPIMREQALKLRGSVAWRHDLTGDTPERDFSFTGSDAFGIEGLPAAEDSIVVEIGLGVQVAPGVEIGVNYSGQMGDGLSDQGVNAGVRVSF